MTSKEIQAWSDEAMFSAEKIDQDKGPEVFLLSCNPDPLGSIAAAAKAYKGEFVESLSQITDEERRYYLTEVQKSVLAMPLESVQFHFRIRGVTRGFTHQMVRQRTAAYSQESTRFAVKEDVPVGLPPSIQSTKSADEYWAEEEITAVAGWTREHLTERGEELAYIERNAGKEQLWRMKWDEAVEKVEEVYNYLVNAGMPAEDARGLLPTNLLTQINYITDLRGLKEHAGVRLCTQAQFEWRQVWAQMVKAIRDYGNFVDYLAPNNPGDYSAIGQFSSKWQFDALADIFRPICYYRGSCQFEADFDRKCSIRDRVEAFSQANVPSTKWNETGHTLAFPEDDQDIEPIFPAEWLLDPGAAR